VSDGYPGSELAVVLQMLRDATAAPDGLTDLWTNAAVEDYAAASAATLGNAP
jgi:hypothetical protein